VAASGRGHPCTNSWRRPFYHHNNIWRRIITTTNYQHQLYNIRYIIYYIIYIIYIYSNYIHIFYNGTKILSVFFQNSCSEHQPTRSQAWAKVVSRLCPLGSAAWGEAKMMVNSWATGRTAWRFRNGKYISTRWCPQDS
jgi:hypothetical protein